MNDQIEYIATITLDEPNNIGEHTGLLYVQDGNIWCRNKTTREDWDTTQPAGADLDETLYYIRQVWGAECWDLRIPE